MSFFVLQQREREKCYVTFNRLSKRNENESVTLTSGCNIGRIISPAFVADAECLVSGRLASGVNPAFHTFARCCSKNQSKKKKTKNKS